MSLIACALERFGVSQCGVPDRPFQHLFVFRINGFRATSIWLSQKAPSAASVRRRWRRIFVLDAVLMAVRRRRRPRGTMIHSDQGTQYGSDAWRRFCHSNNHLEPSMSRKANCWDNAVAESFLELRHSHLRRGTLHHTHAALHTRTGYRPGNNGGLLSDTTSTCSTCDHCAPAFEPAAGTVNGVSATIQSFRFVTTVLLQNARSR